MGCDTGYLICGGSGVDGHTGRPYGSQLFETTDSMVQAEMMADAYQSNPVVATVMTGCSILGLVFMIITFIFTLLDSKWGENKYGPSPKYQ